MAIYNTPGINQVAKLAELALNSTQGLEIKFTVERYGSLQLANGAARSFQSYFGNLRNAERRRVVAEAKKRKSKVNVTLLETPFDDLVCNKRDLPQGAGFSVFLLPSYLVDFGEVIDPASGESLKLYTKEAHLCKVALMMLMNAAQDAERNKSELVNPLNSELESVWFATQQATAISWYEHYKLPLPIGITDPHAALSSGSIEDIPLDANPFTFGLDKEE